MSGKQVTLKGRILMGYAVPLVLTIIASGVVVANARRVEEFNQAKDLGWSVVRDTDRLEISIVKRQRAVRGYLLFQKDASLQDYQQNVQVSNEVIQGLEASLKNADPEQLKRLRRTAEITQELHAINENLFALVQSGKVKDAVQILAKGAHEQLTAEMTENLNALNQTEDKLQDERTRDSNEAMQMLIIATVAGAISATVLAVLLGVLIASRISRTINQVVNQVASSSTEIAASVEQQERAAAEQTASVSQVSTTMDELAASARQSAQQADAAAIGAKQVLSLVDGRQADEGSGQTTASLRDKVNKIAEQILTLSEQTSQIGLVSTLVSELANQTNMLALNAAVEAVRVGEQGKGFGVVAAEIRQLAEKSRNSAERINTLVNDIRSATNTTVMVTDEGTKVVETIVEAVGKIVQNGQQISLTSQQQAIAIGQVVNAMTTLKYGVTETASGLAQTKTSTQQLNEASQQLKAVV
jgi:CHASE3 domain sensor protein